MMNMQALSARKVQQMTNATKKQLEKNRTYWKKRFSAIEELKTESAEKVIADLEINYRKAQQELENQILSWYNRFAQNNEIDLLEAKRLLNTRELAEFRWDVDEYIKYAKENKISKQWTKQLENASARFHVSRLEALKIQTQHTVEKLFGNQLDMIDELMKKQYLEGYYHTVFEVQKGFNVGWNISGINENKLNAILKRPWTTDERTFSDRIWQNKIKLNNELHKHLTQNVLQGRPPHEVVKGFTAKLKNEKYNAARLIATESAYFSSVSQKDAFEELDVEQFEILATLDSTTSKICQEKDGEVYPMSEYQPGVTAPPFHPWCRSTTVPYFEDDYGERAARDGNGKTYYVDSKMKYPEWKESFVDGDSKGNAQNTVKVGDTDGTSSIKSIESIDFNDNNAIMTAIDNFCSEYAYADIEHAIVISPEGKAYRIEGTSFSVNPSLVGRENLRGSIGIHNHPVLEGLDMADSFSKDDLVFAAEYKLGMQYLVSGKRRNAFSYKGDLTGDKIGDEYKKSLGILRQQVFENNQQIEWEQAAIMLILVGLLEGFEFYENF